MEKIDYKKELKQFYQPSAKEVVLVDIPPMHYLMIDGEGDPNSSQAYADAVEALFTVSYTVKFMVKKGPLATDYGVMPLEGLWWSEDMASFLSGDQSGWKWTMMIMQPSCVTRELIDEAIAQVHAKKKLAALSLLRYEALEEGQCAQILHIGPFSEEGPTVVKVHDFIAQNGQLAGKHHEIYLSDIRRADPAKWKTIIRQPLR
jgi:hypothetical protein